VTWQGTLIGGRSSIEGLAADPVTPDILYAAENSFGSIRKTTDGGSHWSFLPITPGVLPVFSVLAVAVDPANASIVYAGTSRGVYKSTDAGGTWKIANNGLSNTSINVLATDHVTGGRLIAGTFSAPDAFVAKLNPAGSTLAFSTYLG